VPEVCVWCGLETESADACCAEVRARSVEERQQMYATYAVCDGDPARLPMTLGEADARVLAHRRAGLADLDPPSPNEALEAATWWYIPRSWIGCAGYVVEKADGAVFELGSCHSLELCFWAQARGLLRDVGDLVIDGVADRERAVATLCRVLRYPTGEHSSAWRYPAGAIEAALDDPPARFPRQRLWFELGWLRESVDAGAFTCRLDPAGECPLRPGAWRVALDVVAFRAVADDDALRGALADAVYDLRLDVVSIEADHHEAMGIGGRALDERRTYQRRSRVVWRQVDALFGPGGAEILISDDPDTSVPPHVQIRPLAALVAYVTGRTE
jgi:hypothetical protein